MQTSSRIVNLTANEIKSIFGGGYYGPKWEVLKYGSVGFAVGLVISFVGKFYGGAQGHIDTLKEYAGSVKDYAKVLGEIHAMRFFYCWYYSTGPVDRDRSLSAEINLDFKIKAD